MKKNSIINAVRETIVFVLFTISALCLFAEPTDTPYWFIVLVGSKVIALLSGLAGYRLFEKWRNAKAMTHDFSFLDD